MHTHTYAYMHTHTYAYYGTRELLQTQYIYRYTFTYIYTHMHMHTAPKHLQTRGQKARWAVGPGGLEHEQEGQKHFEKIERHTHN